LEVPGEGHCEDVHGKNKAVVSPFPYGHRPSLTCSFEGEPEWEKLSEILSELKNAE
jgi:hypothetical protein